MTSESKISSSAKLKVPNIWTLLKISLIVLALTCLTILSVFIFSKKTQKENHKETQKFDNNNIHVESTDSSDIMDEEINDTNTDETNSRDNSETTLPFPNDPTPESSDISKLEENLDSPIYGSTKDILDEISSEFSDNNSHRESEEEESEEEDDDDSNPNSFRQLINDKTKINPSSVNTDSVGIIGFNPPKNPIFHKTTVKPSSRVKNNGWTLQGISEGKIQEGTPDNQTIKKSSYDKSPPVYNLGDVKPKENKPSGLPKIGDGLKIVPKTPRNPGNSGSNETKQRKTSNTGGGGFMAKFGKKYGKP